MSVAISPAELSALLHRVYVIAGDSSRASEFLALCCQHTRADCGVFALRELATGKWRYVDYCPGQPDATRQYQARYAAHDPLAPALLRLAPRRFYCRKELVSEEQLRSNPFFTEWHASLGLEELCAASFPIGDDYCLNVAFLRKTGAPAFGSREIELLDLLLPHIEQAMRLHNHLDRLNVMADLAQEHLAQTGAGIVVLNEDGQVNVLDRTAERIVAESAQLVLTRGILWIANPALQARFRTLVTSCIALSRRAGTMPGGALSVPRPQGPPLGLMVLPYRSRQGLKTVISQWARAVVILYDPARPRLDPPQILRELYGLTEAEVQVCWRLANGDSIADTAHALGIGRETVRSQLKRIFAKTGTSRQPELVRVVLLGPALWAHLPEGFRELLPELTPPHPDKTDPFGSISANPDESPP